MLCGGRHKYNNKNNQQHTLFEKITTNLIVCLRAARGEVKLLSGDNVAIYLVRMNIMCYKNKIRFDCLACWSRFKWLICVILSLCRLCVVFCDNSFRFILNSIHNAWEYLCIGLFSVVASERDLFGLHVLCMWVSCECDTVNWVHFPVKLLCPSPIRRYTHIVDVVVRPHTVVRIN